MNLSIKDPEANRLARIVASYTGETITQAVITALRERLAKTEHQAKDKKNLVEDILAISDHCAKLPNLDKRSDEEILGYDDITQK